MNWDVVEGKWKELKGRVREKWAKLNDDDIEVVGGKFDRLSGRLQERYGLAKDDADRQISEWIDSL